MDPAERLIHSFKTQQPTGPRGQAYAGKLEIVKDLEHVQDPRVLPFFLDVAADQSEYDLARIEVLTILRLKSYDEQQRAKVGQVVVQVLLSDPDDDVRRHAAITLQRFMDVEGVLDAVGAVVLDSAEDIDVRYNAFGALQRLGPTAQAVEILRILHHDPELGPSAARVLDEWKARDT